MQYNIMLLQILGPSLQSQQCQETLLSSVAHLSTAGQQLAASVAPLQDDPKHGSKARDTLQTLQKLESELEELRKACKSPGKLKFMKLFRNYSDVFFLWNSRDLHLICLQKF